MIKATERYNLFIISPTLAKEWHPTKNGTLTPKDVTPNSGKRVWWLCDKGHEWQTTIDCRNIRKTKCPYCSGKLSSNNNNLLVDNPSLAKEWYPTKNGNLTTKDITPHAARKVWWLCKKGHEWQATVDSRNRKNNMGSGCPYCSGRVVSNYNSLQILNLDLAKEWHPVKNGKLTPNDVTLHSNKKIWWICSKGHEWLTSIAHRSRGQGCPYCCGRLISTENCLQTVNPNLAKEWHPTKNGDLTPKDVTPFSNKKVWWLCKRGHEWQAGVAHRSIGTGCPLCHSQTSLLELRIYTEIKSLFEHVEHRRKIHGVECDIYIPDFKIAIEVDSLYWHKNKYVADERKTKLLRDKDIFLLRIRQKGLNKISPTDIVLAKKFTDFRLLKEVITVLSQRENLSEGIREKLRIYLKNKVLINDAEFVKLFYMLPSPFPGLSLFDINTALAKEWHPSKNGTLTPKDVAPNSNIKVWWLCSKKHEWRATVNNRSNDRRCPYCSGKKVCKDNCLQTLNPILAKEWHPTKNGNLTPLDVTRGSSKKIWWICQKGHEWATTISHRTEGNDCPYCIGRSVCKDNCLEAVNPRLAKEWHPFKNGKLTPKDITSGSGKIVWWICQKGHEWQNSISNRKKGQGCPYCYGLKPTEENNLLVVNPSLAQQWHPTKNNNLTPKDFTPFSGKKVWWICKKGHEWRASISNRNDKGRGCPYCSGYLAHEATCLQTLNPLLAKEWHPTKNINLTPKNVTAHSGRKVWWLCKNGHEWQATISNRSNGNNCPYCSGRKKK